MNTVPGSFVTELINLGPIIGLTSLLIALVVWPSWNGQDESSSCGGWCDGDGDGGGGD